MLKKRLLTAAILLTIVLATLCLLPPIYFFGIVSLIILGGAWEWSHLMEMRNTASRLLYVVIVIVVLFNLLFIPAPLIFLVAFIWWIVATLLILLYPRGSERWGKGVFWRGLMGLLVLAPGWVGINFILNQERGVYSLLFLFALIWGADSAAYFTGKMWGKQALAPSISPGKTIQGLIGAIVFSMIIAIIAVWLSQTPPKLWMGAISLSLITILFSVIGDLFESMLKRKSCIKDSGCLLPGHGGILDRIDSLTAAAPIFALGALILGRLQ